MANDSISDSASNVKLTEIQRKFILALQNDRIWEAREADNRADWFYSYKAKSGWIEVRFPKADIQPLIDAGFLVEFPNRWSPDLNVVIINKERRAETLALAAHCE